MQKFLVLLMDNQTGKINWQYPNEINGTSKQEIYKLMSQDIPPESIHEILTEEEYYNKYSKRVEGKTGTNDQAIKQNIEDISVDQFDSGNDYFNSVLNAANEAIDQSSDNINNTNNINKESKQNNKNNKKNNNKQLIDQSVNTTNNIVDIKYFEEGGIKFKLENGVLFKKVWKQVLLNGQKTPSGDEAVSEFRLVSSSTKKLVSVDKVELQRLEWEEVKTH